MSKSELPNVSESPCVPCPTWLDFYLSTHDSYDSNTVVVTAKGSFNPLTSKAY